MTDFIVVEGSGSTINVIEASPTQMIVEVITPGPKGDPGAVSSVNGIPPAGNGNVTISKSDIGLSNVSNTSDSAKPVSVAQAAENTATLNSAKSYTDTARSDLSTANTATLNSAKAYAESLVIGLWDDRGNYSAAGGAYPTTGGSGTAGAVLKGDIWTISVGGTLSSVQIDVKQTLRALIDAPGQTAANWAIASANTALDDAITDNVVGRAPSQNSVFKALALKAPLVSPTFTGIPAVPTPAVDTNSTQAVNAAFVLGQLSSATPLMNGVAAIGISLRTARHDHVHASDTSKVTVSTLAATGGAATVGNTPAGNISSITVQAAINELDAEKAPLASPNLTGNPTAPTPAQFDNDTSIATTQFVKNAGMQFSSSAIKTLPTTLTNSDVGGLILLGGSGSVTLPLASSCRSGDAITLLNSTLSPVTLNRSGAEQLIVNGGAYVNSIVLQAGDSIRLATTLLPSALWVVEGGSGGLQFSSAFGSSLTSNGYQRLPSGLIMQWGSFVVSAAPNTLQSLSYPIAFPTLCMSITGGSSSTNSNCGVAQLSASQFQVFSNNTGAAMSWIAIGK